MVEQQKRKVRGKKHAMRIPLGRVVQAEDFMTSASVLCLISIPIFFLGGLILQVFFYKHTLK